jgi:replicative DNA helicase
MVVDKLQPNNVEAEEAVLGSILIDPDAILEVINFLKPKDFFIAKNGFVYESMLELHKADQPADLVTLADDLQRRERLDGIGGAAYLTNLIHVTPTSVHVEYYARIVERTAIRRRVIQAASKIAEIAYKDDESDAAKMVSDAMLTLSKVAGEVQAEKNIHISGAVERYYDDLLGKQLDTIPTGLPDLDKILGGLHKQDLIIIPGRPGMGKTSLALSIALNAARKFEKRVLIHSLEMGDKSLVQRLSSAEMNISVTKIRNRQLTEEQWAAHYASIESLAKLPIFIDDRAAVTATQIRSTALKVKAEHGLDMIIVDYIQIMGTEDPRSNRNDQVGFMARALKNLARDLDVPVLALSQLSRECEKRADKRPMLSDLRDSGGLEAEADAVVATYRDKVYNPTTEFPNVAELIILKQRNGATGTISTYFKEELAQFVPLEVHTTSLNY